MSLCYVPLILSFLYKLLELLSNPPGTMHEIPLTTCYTLSLSSNLFIAMKHHISFITCWLLLWYQVLEFLSNPCRKTRHHISIYVTNMYMYPCCLYSIILMNLLFFDNCLLLCQVLEFLSNPSGETRHEEREQALLELLNAGDLLQVDHERLLQLAEGAKL